MSYLDGFVIAVPSVNKDAFIAHARKGDTVFTDFGATRVVETWGDNVPRGQTTDFQGAVAAGDDESIVFSWIEWPDKATRDAGMARMMAPDFKDERMDPEKNPMPFDGKRMIYGGFQPEVSLGEPDRGDYVQGFLLPVAEEKRAAYFKLETDTWPIFQGYGALSLVAAWGDDVPQGEQTDFYRAVKAEPGMPRMKDVPSSVWSYYIGVDNIDRAVAAVRAGGGSITQEPIEIPSGDFSAMGIDPQGAHFGLVGPRQGD